MANCKAKGKKPRWWCRCQWWLLPLAWGWGFIKGWWLGWWFLNF